MRRVNEEGEDAMRLTPKGVQVANQAAMSSDDDVVAMFDALLDGNSPRS